MSDKNTHATGLRYHDSADGRVRLLVMDHHPAVRRGLKMRLALEEDLEVVGEAGDADGAIPLARALRPDVILLGAAMPGGPANTETLRTAAPHGVVVVSNFHDASTTRERTREASVATFVAKRRTQGVLLAAIGGAAPANAKRRLHERAPASREEDREDAVRDRGGS